MSVAAIARSKKIKCGPRSSTNFRNNTDNKHSCRDGCVLASAQPGCPDGGGAVVWSFARVAHIDLPAGGAAAACWGPGWSTLRTGFWMGSGLISSAYASATTSTCRHRTAFLMVGAIVRNSGFCVGCLHPHVSGRFGLKMRRCSPWPLCISCWCTCTDAQPSAGCQKNLPWVPLCRRTAVPARGRVSQKRTTC